MIENENSARPRCDFIYTKHSARPRSDFMYTKNFQEGRCDRKLRFYNKETAFAGYKIFQISNFIIFYFLSTQRISRMNFFRKIRSDFIYTNNFQEGRCDRKWRFYKKETAFAGYTFFQIFHFIIFYLHKEFLKKNQE